MHLFDQTLSTFDDEVAFRLHRLGPIEWLDFLLNPRRLRGSDFLMRWSQGVWSERRIIQAVEDTGEFFAIPYGPSSVAPEDARALELYFERLEKAGLGKNKRPDLLIFTLSDQNAVDTLVKQIGGLGELPFTPEDNESVRTLLQRAVLAIECENSLWKGKNMPDYGSALKPQKRLGGKPGLKKGAVVPTLILKEEDRKPLQAWQDTNRIPIHIWHVFYDLAFGISLDEAQKLIRRGFILPDKHKFQAPSGANTEKIIYKIYYHYAYEVGSTQQEPELKAKFIEDKNGHILPYVHFEGGRMRLSDEALQILRDRAHAQI